MPLNHKFTMFCSVLRSSVLNIKCLDYYGGTEDFEVGRTIIYSS